GRGPWRRSRRAWARAEVALEAKPTLGHEEGVERRRRHTSAERGEPRQQLGLWASDFMQL
ncbi:MAG: hypothetical protein WA881_03850, partial [Candidatus Sulfotelmatobacter sp.]